MSFMVDWEMNVRPLPRYAELLAKRGRELRAEDLDRVAATFSDQELTDLQLLFNLAWMGFGAAADEPAVAALREKGRDFTRGDVDALLAAQARLAAGIVPRWRALADRGQVELSTTPYYHPILPLLCDSDAAQRALPGLPLPPRFAHPEDARWHVRAAVEAHARWFGRPPAGTWPAEGSVSPEALEVLAGEGLRWAASDEGVLLRSLGQGASRLRSIYRPWRVSAGRSGELPMLFRDRGLSDVIGFTYSRLQARDAVRDFVAHVAGVGDAWAADGRHGPATVGVFLDGENAWEHYPRSGHEFLDRLYGALEASDRIETVTMAEATGEAKAPALPRIHSGSWIEASYRIWIGHAEDRRAWTALGQARDAVARAEAAGQVPAARLERARRHLYQAEASDWCWWYGDDFTTELSFEFDALFRGHLVEAARLVGAEPPPEALVPIKQAASGAPPGLEARPLREPTVLLAPTLDGRVSDFFEWAGSGLLRPAQPRGAMYGAAQAFGVLHYGFDLERLYLRLDPAESAARTAEVATQLRVSLVAGGRRGWVDFPLRPDAAARPGRGREGEAGRIVFGEVVELAVPFAAAGVVPGDRLGVVIQALRDEVEVERLPRLGQLGLTVPDRDFERLNWRV
jgi:alpha-amylase/alpha-mannosidase (GH57 family)